MPRIKEKYKIGIYLRFGSRVYTSFEEIEREKQKRIAMSKMTPEQIEFCETIKQEIESKKLAPMR